MLWGEPILIYVKKQPQAGHQQISGIHYWWLKTPTYKKNGIRRFLSMLIFIAQLFLHWKSLLDIHADVVIASSTYPLDIYPAKILANKSKAKLVFELHDLWPLSPKLIGRYSSFHPFIWLMQRAEDYMCKHSDYVISLLWNTKGYLESRGLDGRKFHCIPNGFDVQDWKNKKDLPETHRVLLEKWRRDGALIVGYAGGHAKSNALEILLEVALKARNENIVFVLVGDGMCKLDLMQYAQRQALKHVLFLDAVDKLAIPTLISYFDIAYMGGVHSTLHKYGTSFNKLTDYMLAEKPIIASLDDPSLCIERLGCGFRVEAQNAEEIYRVLKRMSSMTKQEREEMGRKGRVYVLESLNYEYLSKQIIQIISSS
ncbi:MAG: glycosyltransferase family 4 protein [Bacteroidales bacterium]